MTTSVRIRYGRTVDVTAWEQRHAAGQVPDRWPYGLHQLAGAGLRVGLAQPDRSHPTLARGLRAFGGYEWWESRGESTGEPFDVELCWAEKTGIPAALRSGRGDRPPVVTGVIWLTDHRVGGAHRRLARAALGRARQVWALSSAQLPVLSREFGVPANRLTHLLFGIDADFFHPADPADAPTPGLVVGAGNDQHRDHATLIAAAALAQQGLAPRALAQRALAAPGHTGRAPTIRLEVATRQSIVLPAELGVRHNSLDHPTLRELYWRSQIVAVALRPNLHVSGVTVVLEAMACARPVVVTDTPGMRDYVRHGATGLLVPPGDPDAMAAALIELVADPDRARALGLAGRRAVEDRFTTRAQGRHLADLVAQV